MYDRKSMAVWSLFVVSVSLIAASLTAVFLTSYYSRASFEMLGGICQEIVEKQPEAKAAVLSAWKTYQGNLQASKSQNIISSYGYTRDDFLPCAYQYGAFCAALGFVSGALLFLAAFFVRHRKEAARIRMLANELEKVNVGGGALTVPVGEDEFSKLQDEICKTVTMLYQTRDAALEAKKNFADNLYNIAHQMKTPLTAVSLSLQMWQEHPSPSCLPQIHRQISRLAHLEDDLLLLSRVDAGTLPLERQKVDVFTVLTLAADHLEELLLKEQISVEIPEAGEALICADMDWTMEAVANLFKNCMEHTPNGGVIRCFYEQNPIYTKIRICDTGPGFAKKDIPHLFERFYRGEHAKSGGIGIGLAISKAIIESQNGTISAQNLADGGACFEIRFYAQGSH